MLGLIYIGYIGGLLISIKAILALAQLIQELFFLKELNLIERYGNGSYAAITGSTDGIGWVFAKELAKRGFNILSISRNKEKLEKRRSELLALYPSIKVSNIKFDFKDCTDVEKLGVLRQQLEMFDVSLVVNNVGLRSSSINTIDLSMQQALNMALVNTLAQFFMTKFAVTGLIDRKRGGIIDVSSVSALGPFPKKELYCASKVFNQRLNRSLGLKLDKKLDLLVLKPGFVPTSQKRKIDFITCTAEQCVNGALRALGQRNETYGDNKHILFGSAVELLLFLVPLRFLTPIRRSIYKLVRYEVQ